MGESGRGKQESSLSFLSLSSYLHNFTVYLTREADSLIHLSLICFPHVSQTLVLCACLRPSQCLFGNDQFKDGSVRPSRISSRLEY